MRKTSQVPNAVPSNDTEAETCLCCLQFAELETLLGDSDRAAAIYELAVNQPRLDMPELLWKAYIDFEVNLGELDKARLLYERLLERTLHVKVGLLRHAQFWRVASWHIDSMSMSDGYYGVDYSFKIETYLTKQQNMTTSTKQIITLREMQQVCEAINMQRLK